ncbi:hypothetical protein HPP92_025702 [Vanilla planifolia]|uniref:30S ribosomal protein S4, chloroplastic n=1 Tax=Vanilla planifolia TaxID=51239 RepID=A0A835U996_VANPL|nr:hypothetical protein HPP92_025702 [Vanilla planifolia]
MEWSIVDSLESNIDAGQALATTEEKEKRKELNDPRVKRARVSILKLEDLEMAMRKLKFHEKKLLKKVNFIEYKREKGHREALITRRYSGICKMVQKLVHILKQMDPRDPFRIEMTDALLEQLYNMGVIPTKKSLVKCEKLSVSSFCRRRLATVLVQLKFAEHLNEATTYIEQGHIRVGPDTVTDPAYLITKEHARFYYLG